jgi:Family of unknown function (DUF5906)
MADLNFQAANKSTPAHDMAVAKDFLTLLDPNTEKFAFRFISDGADRRRSNIRFLTLEEAWAVVEAQNTPTHRIGVFLLPNTPQPRVLLAAADNEEQIDRAHAAITACGATVDMIVNDNGRLRLCYVCPDIPPERLVALQKHLSAKLGTDPTAIDLPYLRLPGTLNLEDPATPRLVTLVRNGASANWKVADLFDKLDKLELSSSNRSSTALDQNTQFLSRVVPWPENPNDDGASGHVNIHWTMRKNGEVLWPGKPTRTVTDFLKLVRWVLGQPDPGNIYFCTSLQRECARNAKGRPKAIRSAENALALKAIWLDIDIKPPPKGYATIEEALKAIDKFKDHYELPAPTYIVASGNGLHVYWISTRTLSVDEWRPFAEGLKAAALAFGLRCDTQCTVNCAQILRVPETYNFKTKIPKRVYIGFEGEELDFAIDLKQLPDLVPVKKAKPNQDKGQESSLLVDFGPVKAGCGWLHGVCETGGKDQSEVLWRDALRVSMFLKDGKTLIHKFSEEHEGYDFAETEKKFDEAFKAKKAKDLGWPQCRTIHDHHDDPSTSPCASCPHRELDRSPLNLAPGADAGVKLEDFYAYMPTHDYIFAPSREHWPAASVNARIPPIETGKKDKDGDDETIPASRWLDQNQPVEMATWAPGMPMIIADRLIAEGGWIERKGVFCFNLYRPPTIELGDASKAGPWIELVHKVYPDDANYIIKWFAQRRQHPDIKINHSLLMGGVPGIGKDTIIEPVKRAIGEWNFKEITAKNVFKDFNPWLRSVILRISEVKDMGDINRFEFYEGTKTLMAAPPDVLECNEKHIKQHYIMNCTGVLITTNHLTDGIFLPADDRRHYVAWSKCVPTNFASGYFNEIWKWYDDEGGDRHVAAYLATLDISDFDPKATPPKTSAFWSIVNANRTGEEGELQDVLDKLGNPDAVTLDQIKEATPYNSYGGDKDSFGHWLRDRKNRKAINHRLDNCGYCAVNSPDAKDGLWRIDGRRQAVYAKTSLTLSEQQKAAAALQRAATEAKAAKEAKAVKTARAAKARAAKARAAEEAESAYDLKNIFGVGSPSNPAESKPTGFRIIDECEETTICIVCGQTGGVKRIKPVGRPGVKAETLHEACADKHEW